MIRKVTVSFLASKESLVRAGQAAGLDEAACKYLAFFTELEATLTVWDNGHVEKVEIGVHENH